MNVQFRMFGTIASRSLLSNQSTVLPLFTWVIRYARPHVVNDTNGMRCWSLRFSLVMCLASLERYMNEVCGFLLLCPGTLCEADSKGYLCKIRQTSFLLLIHKCSLSTPTAQTSQQNYAMFLTPLLSHSIFHSIHQSTLQG